MVNSELLREGALVFIAFHLCLLEFDKYGIGRRGDGLNFLCDLGSSVVGVSFSERLRLGLYSLANLVAHLL